MISIEYNTRKESGKPSTYARLGDVPDGGGLHNVPDHKLPDRLQKKTSYKTQFEFVLDRQQTQTEKQHLEPVQV